MCIRGGQPEARAMPESSVLPVAAPGLTLSTSSAVVPLRVITCSRAVSSDVADQQRAPLLANRPGKHARSHLLRTILNQAQGRHGSALGRLIIDSVPLMGRHQRCCSGANTAMARRANYHPLTVD